LKPLKTTTFMLVTLATLTLVSSAQEPENRGVITVTFSDVTAQVAAVSDAYLSVFQKREHEGLMTLSVAEVRVLNKRLEELKTRLNNVSIEGTVTVPELGDEQRSALLAALACQSCVGKLGETGRLKWIDTRAQLRGLLLERCNAIGQLLPPDGQTLVNRQTLLALELHLSYIRQVTIAFV
jgi:hypothetical protein